MAESCSKMVWGDFHTFTACPHPGKVQREGRWYCGRHDSDALDERQRKKEEARQVRWDASRANEARARQQRETAERIVRGVAGAPYWPPPCNCPFCCGAKRWDHYEHEAECIVTQARALVAEWDAAKVQA